MSSLPDIKEAIAKNAAGPRRASGDSGSVEQHAIADQILGDRYVKTNEAATKRHGGIRFVNMIPPGASGC